MTNAFLPGGGDTDKMQSQDQISLADPPFRIVMRRLADLHFPRIFDKYRICEASATFTTTSWDPNLVEPIFITRPGTIIKGFDIYELARRNSVEVVACLEFELHESEAIEWILEHNRPRKGLNAPSRGLLALESMEPELRERAKQNQRAGGKRGLWESLPKAVATNCRREIARRADVGEKTVDCMRRARDFAAPDVMTALLSEEASIHRVSRWLDNPKTQCEMLQRYREKRDNKNRISAKVNRLLNGLKSRDHQSEVPPTFSEFCSALQRLAAGNGRRIHVGILQTRRRIILASTSVLRDLSSQKELFSG